MLRIMPPSFPPASAPGGRQKLEQELRSYESLIRLPPNILEEDLLNAARAGLWELLRRTPERATGFVARRIRGAVLDELRAQDWLTRRARAQQRGARFVGLSDLAPEQELTATQEEPDALAKAALERALARLEPRDQALLRALYVQDIPQNALAEQWGVTGPRIHQLHARALERLRALILHVEPLGVSAPAGGRAPGDQRGEEKGYPP
jgi:RNA polymerase sigma factor FliA